MSSTPLQTIIDPSTDPSLTVYATNTQSIPPIASATVIITNTQEYVTDIFNLKAEAAGIATEIQFNDGSGLAGDSGFTFNQSTETLFVGNTIITNSIRADNILYANGQAYSLSSTYGNGNVSSLLPTYSGNFTAGNIVIAHDLNSYGNIFAINIAGSGAELTNLPAANISGVVANAAHASLADSATTIAGANVNGYVGNATHATLADSATTIAGANVTGYVANASHATVADSSNAVAGANVTGTVLNANNASYAGIITGHSQPNITSTGTLTSLNVTGNVQAGHFVGDGSYLTNLPGSTPSSIVNGTSNINIGTSGGNITVTAGGTTTITFSTTATSTSYTSGAITINGGLGANGNIHAIGHITSYETVYAGSLADFGSFTVPKFIGRDAGASYIQGALINTNQYGSADWISYPDNYDVGTYGDHGWVDIGFTSSNFDPTVGGIDTYSITKSNDGYVFAGAVNGSYGGNLILATDYTGANNDIIFGLGGFTADKEFARMNNTTKSFEISGNIVPTANVTYNLGNTTHRFKDLWLSGTTIHLGGTSISVDPTTGNITMGNISISGSGTITGNSVTGQVANALIAGTVTSGAQPNITSLGNLLLANVTGNLIAGNTNAGNLLTANYISGVLTTHAQPNITSVGTLTNLNVTGNVTATYFVGDGGILSNVTATSATRAGTVTTNAQPNITSVGTLSSLTVSGNINAANLNGNGSMTTLSVTGTSNLGAVGNVTITGGTNGQVLTTNGSGGLSWTTASGGSPAGAGIPSYNGVFALSSQASNASYWSTFTLNGNLYPLFTGGGNTSVSSQTAYGYSLTSGNKTLVINDSAIQTNTYGLVVQMPSSPSVGDTVSAPIVSSPGGSPAVGKLIYVPASGQQLVVINGGGGGGSSIISSTQPSSAAYLDLNSGMGTQPITWVYAGVISSVPTWYQMFF